MNRFEAQGLSGNFEFEADQEFDGAELEGADFGEAGFGEAEFDGGEFEGEWDGEVRDHRRRPSPQTAARVRDHRRPAAYRSGYQTKPMVVAIALVCGAAIGSMGNADRLWVASLVPFFVQPLVPLVYRPWSAPRWSGATVPVGTARAVIAMVSERPISGPVLAVRTRSALSRHGVAVGLAAVGRAAVGLGSLGPPAPPLSLWHRRIGLRAAFHLRRACRAALRGAADAAARGHGRAASSAAAMAEPPAEPPMAEPNATTRRRRQRKARRPSEEFFIEPEAFEFETGARPGYEGIVRKRLRASMEAASAPARAKHAAPLAPVDKNPAEWLRDGREIVRRAFQFRSSAVQVQAHGPANHGTGFKSSSIPWATDHSLVRSVPFASKAIPTTSGRQMPI